MKRGITLTTGSRLHFGLIGWGTDHERQFGGVGVMVEPPGISLTATAAEEFSAAGSLADRATAMAKRLAGHWQLDYLPACRLEILSAPPEHAGLGTGTGLALSVGTALATFLGRKELSLEELVLSMGRGLRSAVGVHGFANGGLIYEDGKAVNELLGRLRARILLPESWRIVLIHTLSEPGLWGSKEQQAFEIVRSTAGDTAEKLRVIAERLIVPAAQGGDFASFSEAVADYNRLAGSCFAAVQGGDYASPEIAELVAALQLRGVVGVGQSSWGPTVFAFAPDEEAARELANWVSCEQGYEEERITIASPRNSGYAARLQEAVARQRLLK